MQRVQRAPRPDWHERLRGLGIPEPVYTAERGTQERDWHEEAVYVFSRDEVATLQAAAETVRGLVIEAVDAALADSAALERMAIGPELQSLLRWSWDARQRNLISRYDWCFDGNGPPKLLEINGETCYGMVLASRAQAELRDTEYRDHGQWNDLEASLVQSLRRYGGLQRGIVHFACDAADPARRYETAFVEDAARAAKLKTHFVAQDDIAFDTHKRCFVDDQDRPITALFLFQMWELTIDSAMAEWFFEPERVSTTMLEPVWRLLVSNKAFLAWLWERNEGHELLLPTYRDFDPRADRLGDTYAEKPIYGFEGANVRLHEGGRVIAENPDPEADSSDGMIYQALCPLPQHDGVHPLVSTWEVGATVPALSIREGGLITDYFAPLVPHIIE